MVKDTIKQFVGSLPANCLSVIDHFVGLALNGLRRGPKRSRRKLKFILFHKILSAGEDIKQDYMTKT